MAFESFRCRDTKALFEGQRVNKFRAIETVSLRKLAILNRVNFVDELQVPPGNRLESLVGKRRGQWSIRINDQWRICFRFLGQNVIDVEIVDYH